MGEQFQGLLQAGEKIHPPKEVVKESLVPDYEAYYKETMADVIGYWDKVARSEVTWFTPYQQVLEREYPYAEWFVGGKINICYNVLDRHADGERRNKAALIWLGEDGEERIFTFAMLRRQVARMAGGLKELGVKKGDRVVIYMPMTPEGVIAMLACARIGAIHSVVYAGLGAAALCQRIDDAQAKVIICSDVSHRRGRRVGLKSIVNEAVDGNPVVEKVIVHRRIAPTIALDPGELDFYDVMGMGSNDTPCEVMDSEDMLFILYTSGSTGKPKGCTFTHGGFAVGTQHLWRMSMDIQENDVYFCTSDIGWMVGHAIMVYGPLANGTTLVAREGAPDYPHPGIIWEIIDRLEVSKFFTAPTALRMFMRYGPEYLRPWDLSSLKVMICAGEALNPEAQRWALEHITQGRGVVVDNWWQTELAGPTLGTLPSMPAKPGMVGKSFPGVKVEVLDKEGNPVAPGQGGLLTIRGIWPQMFRSVWGAPERYEEYFNIIPGVYVAGDVATVDEEGYISVLGRADDVLSVAGHRLGTADLESALVSHPAVAEAAVIGKPDAIKGESIKAFVILRAGQAPGNKLSDALMSHVRHQLGPIAAPSEIEFVESLPKTRSGKIMRRVLKAQELGVDPGDLSMLEE